MSIKKIVFFIIIIISLLIINNFVHTIYNLWQKNDLVVKAKQNLEREKRENQELKNKLSEVKKKEFVEEEARNKLFLVKPGEAVLLVPDTIATANNDKKQIVEVKANWQKWWELFF